MAAKTTKERIGRVGERRQVVIPREMFEKLHMRERDFVAFAQKNNGVFIKPKRVVDADEVLTPEEAKVVRRGEAQLKRGQSKSWRDVKNALARCRGRSGRGGFVRGLAPTELFSEEFTILR